MMNKITNPRTSDPLERVQFIFSINWFISSFSVRYKWLEDLKEMIYI